MVIDIVIIVTIVIRSGNHFDTFCVDLGFNGHVTVN